MSGPGDSPPVIPVYLIYDAHAKRAGPLLQAKPDITFRWLKAAVKQHFGVDMETQHELTLTARAGLDPVSLDGDVAVEEFVTTLQQGSCLRVAVEGGEDMFAAIARGGDPRGARTSLGRSGSRTSLGRARGGGSNGRAAIPSMRGAPMNASGGASNGGTGNGTAATRGASTGGDISASVAAALSGVEAGNRGSYGQRLAAAAIAGTGSARGGSGGGGGSPGATGIGAARPPIASNASMRRSVGREPQSSLRMSGISLGSLADHGGDPGPSRRMVPSGSGDTISDLSFASANGFLYGDPSAMSRGSNVSGLSGFSGTGSLPPRMASNGSMGPPGPGGASSGRRRRPPSMRHGGPMVNNMIGGFESGGGGGGGGSGGGGGGGSSGQGGRSAADTAKATETALTQMQRAREKAAEELRAMSPQHKQVFDRLQFLLYHPSKLHSPDYDAAMSFTASTELIPAQVAFNELLAKLGRAARGNLGDPWLIKSVRGRPPKCVQLLRLTCRQYHLDKWGAINEAHDPQADLKLSLTMGRFQATLQASPTARDFVTWLVSMLEALMVLKRPTEVFRLPPLMVEAMCESLELRHFATFHCPNCSDIQGWRRCRKCYKEAKKRAAKQKSAAAQQNRGGGGGGGGDGARPLSNRTLRNKKLRPRSLGRQNVAGMPGVRDPKYAHAGGQSSVPPAYGGNVGAAPPPVPPFASGPGVSATVGGGYVVEDAVLFGAGGTAPPGGTAAAYTMPATVHPQPAYGSRVPSGVMRDGGAQHGRGGNGGAAIVLPTELGSPLPAPGMGFDDVLAGGGVGVAGGAGGVVGTQLERPLSLDWDLAALLDTDEGGLDALLTGVPGTALPGGASDDLFL